MIEEVRSILMRRPADADDREGIIAWAMDLWQKLDDLQEEPDHNTENVIKPPLRANGQWRLYLGAPTTTRWSFGPAKRER